MTVLIPVPSSLVSKTLSTHMQTQLNIIPRKITVAKCTTKAGMNLYTILEAFQQVRLDSTGPTTFITTYIFTTKFYTKVCQELNTFFRMRIVKIFNVGFQGRWATSKSKINKMKMKSNQN